MKSEINKKNINEVVSISKKILSLIYIIMIIGIIFLTTLLIKELGILNFIITILKVLTPFFIGFIIAWMFNPLVIKLEKKWLKIITASIIVYFAFISFILLFFYFLIPIIYNQLNDFIDSFPNIISQLKDTFNNITSNIKILNNTNIEDTLFNSLEKMGGSISNNLPEIIINSVGNIFSGIGTIILGLVIGIYMLIDFKNIRRFLLKLLPKKYEKDITKLMNNMTIEVRKCVNGSLLVAFMVFIGDFIGFFLVGLKAPILFAFLCGITDLIPYIGPYIGGCAAVIVGFSQGTITGIITLVIVIIIQLIENCILQPIVISKTMKLNPVTIMVGLLIFGHFFGILGMVIATPTIALIKVIVKFIQEKSNIFSI